MADYLFAVVFFGVLIAAWVAGAWLLDAAYYALFAIHGPTWWSLGYFAGGLATLFTLYFHSFYAWSGEALKETRLGAQPFRILGGAIPGILQAIILWPLAAVLQFQFIKRQRVLVRAGRPESDVATRIAGEISDSPPILLAVAGTTTAVMGIAAFTPFLPAAKSVAALLAALIVLRHIGYAVQHNLIEIIRRRSEAPWLVTAAVFALDLVSLAVGFALVASGGEPPLPLAAVMAHTVGLLDFSQLRSFASLNGSVATSAIYQELALVAISSSALGTLTQFGQFSKGHATLLARAQFNIDRHDLDQAERALEGITDLDFEYFSTLAQLRIAQGDLEGATRAAAACLKLKGIHEIPDFEALDVCRRISAHPSHAAADVPSRAALLACQSALRDSLAMLALGYLRGVGYQPSADEVSGLIAACQASAAGRVGERQCTESFLNLWREDVSASVALAEAASARSTENEMLRLIVVFNAVHVNDRIERREGRLTDEMAARHEAVQVSILRKLPAAFGRLANECDRLVCREYLDAMTFKAGDGSETPLHAAPELTEREAADVQKLLARPLVGSLLEAQIVGFVPFRQ